LNIKSMSLEQQEGESELAFIYRICHMRGSLACLQTWWDVAEWLNLKLNYTYTESYYRKRVQEFDKLFNVLKEDFFRDDYIDLLDTKRELLYKQQVKTQDRLREHRKGMRDEARIENLMETVADVAKQMAPMTLLTPSRAGPCAEGVNEAVLLLGDWHIGAKFANFKNEYSLEIAKERLAYLYQEVVKYLHLMDVRVLHVVNLGDMMEGNIHVSVRVQSEMDVIEQTMQAGELMAALLLNLEQEVETLVYHHVLDNHGRINANKTEHIEKENFGKLMHWWLEERLMHKNSQILVTCNELDDNIGVFTLQNGKNCAFVHGHLDRVNQVFQNLGGILHQTLDYVFMGHLHVAKMKEFQGGKVFLNGSLKGLDPYALDKRYTGNASQFLLVLDGKNEVPIVLNVG
jgi:hypothetical protein